MRGLIYKELSVFFKSLDKRTAPILVGVVAFLMYSIGADAGLLASIMFAVMVGMQNVTGFAVDEKAHWKRYQLAMPVNGVMVVVSKYISVICTLVVSVLGSLLFNLLSSVVFRSFNAAVWGFSAAMAIVIPLMWAVICLPLTYWFGFQSAQIIRLIVVIPFVYVVKYFEDGPGIYTMTDSLIPYVLAAFFAILVLFGISLVISIIGYEKKKQ